MTTVRLFLPPHLGTLTGARGELRLEVAEPATLAHVLDALEARYPVLRGTIRYHRSTERRPLMRFLACGRDLSHEPMDRPLPPQVGAGHEPIHVIGAIAGG